MRVEDLYPDIRAKLKKELDRCTDSIRGFNLHIHVTGPYSSEFPEQFEIQLSTSDRPSRGSHPHPELVSRLKCKIQKETFRNKVMLEVQTYRMSPEPHVGEVFKSGGYNFYEQDWRHFSFFMSADAHALWCVLEQNADLSRIVKEVLTG